jgi:hypothetical protein
MTLLGVFHQNFHDFAFYDSFVFPILLGASSFPVTFILQYNKDPAIVTFVCVRFFTVPCERVAHVTPIPYPLSAVKTTHHA